MFMMNNELNDQMYILDGGMGSQLESSGMTNLTSDPLWSARCLHNSPTAILKVHREYLEAGADVLITASYQATVEGLKKYLDVTECGARLLIGKSVQLAREAINKWMPTSDRRRMAPLVAGSVGPYGACLHDGSEYTGRYLDTDDGPDLAELKEWHRPRMEALVEAGVDLLALETIPALLEAEALLQLLSEFPNQKAWISFSCKDSTCISHGEVFSDCVSRCLQLAPDQLVAVGVNCTPPDLITPLLTSLGPHSPNKPFVVYPNSGELWVPGKGWITNVQPATWSDYVEEWLFAGARYVGGCCQVFPRDITMIRAVVQKTNLPQ